MDAIELLDIIGSKETSKVQFKREITHNDAMAAEFVAMANSLGGLILLGVVDKTGEIIGVDLNSNINERLANIATNNVNPPIYIQTEVIPVANELSSKVLIVHIPYNLNQIFKDNNGAIWVKQGSDKRRVTDDSEILRLYQKSGNLLADEMEVQGTSIADIDEKIFFDYFKKEFEKSYEEKGLTFEQALKAKRVLRNNQLTLAGVLFFVKEPQVIKPAFSIKAVSYFGNDIAGNQYRSKPKGLTGTIPELFVKGMDFFGNNLDHVQPGKNFNAQAKLEISVIALEELIQNALVHRDYFKNSPIRLLIFDNRIEIISPGKLPNSLTVEDIKFGNPVIRNNQLVSFSSHTLPFSGLGSGIKRAIEAEPKIVLINDVEGELFKVIIPRKEKKEI